jgi:hypothetical protein
LVALLRLNKGEITSRTLAFIIVGLIALLLSFFLLKEFLVLELGYNDYQKCRNSIVANNNMANFNIAPDEIECKPIKKEIDNSNTVSASKELADMMVKCWELYGRGKSKLFQTEGLFCSECYVIDFKEKNNQIEGFGSYLATHKYHSFDFDGTYLEYLNNFVPDNKYSYEGNKQFSSLGDKDIKINPNKRYVILFVYGKEKTLSGKIIDSIGKKNFVMGAGFVGGMGGTAIAFASESGIIMSSNLIGGGASLGLGVGSYLAFFKNHEKSHIALVLIKEQTKKDFKDIGCTFFPSIQKDLNK